jgi:hypothetical protein
MMKGHWLGKMWLLLSGLVLLSGCNKDDYTLAFSHNLHVKENGMACKDCHGQVTQGRLVTPGHKACIECHGDWIETKTIGQKTCGMCHKVQDLQVLSSKTPVQPVSKAGGVFVHTEVLTNRCNDCHGQLLEAKTKGVPKQTHSAKVQLRDQVHRWGLDCKGCHVDMDPKTPPASHNRNWTRRHGALGSQDDMVCGVCHREESCRECHQTMMPESHNNLWRLKTHGIRADWDRSRCAVCHEQDSCIACHSVAKPQSHNAGWKDNHCFGCHTSSSKRTGCVVCHEAKIDSHPNPHPAGYAKQHCGTCHPGSPAAEQCKVCHGANQLSTHPDPHPAGWRQRHCFSCHAGASATAECAICHQGGGSVLVHQSSWPPMHNRFGDRANCADCHRP